MTISRRWEYLLPATAMMLGWGLRGFIGGGPFGAMIPGAMVALSLCLIYRWPNPAMRAAFGAIGIGFGGIMTYGQTIGFIVKPDSYGWGLLGLTLKGAIWGLLGGAILGLGFTPKPRIVGPAAILMIGFCWLGWHFVNEPKVIYFSNPIDRPRAEIWAGLLFAGLALLAWLAARGLHRPALRFALAGAMGGAIGFGGGGSIHAACTIFVPHLHLHSWKYMEFFFGFCFGWALAWAAHRTEPPEAAPEPAARPLWFELPIAGLTTLLFFGLTRLIAGRFAYLIAGAGFLVLLTVFRRAAWPVALTATFAAAAMDSAEYWLEHHKGSALVALGSAWVVSAVFAAIVARHVRDARQALLWLAAFCTADALVKFAMHPDGIASLLDHIAIAFVLMGLAVWRMARPAEAAPMEKAAPIEAALR
jgi:hypothetical protein